MLKLCDHGESLNNYSTDKSQWFNWDLSMSSTEPRDCIFPYQECNLTTPNKN